MLPFQKVNKVVCVCKIFVMLMVTVVVQLNAKNMTFAGYFSCRKRPFFSNVTI